MYLKSKYLPFWVTLITSVNLSIQRHSAVAKDDSSYIRQPLKLILLFIGLALEMAKRDGLQHRNTVKKCYVNELYRNIKKLEIHS